MIFVFSSLRILDFLFSRAHSTTSSQQLRIPQPRALLAVTTLPLSPLAKR